MKIDSLSNRRFVAAMHKDYHALPGTYSVATYLAGRCIEAAIEKLAGQTDGRKLFAETVRKLTLIDTPRGPLKFDHLGNAVGDVFIRRCERKNGPFNRTEGRLVRRISTNTRAITCINFQVHYDTGNQPLKHECFQSAESGKIGDGF
jgi:hypothetical protein